MALRDVLHPSPMPLLPPMQTAHAPSTLKHRLRD
eukprot:CAMPEP_0206276674 /NCGR_PEP_ID=MMETSP0047_2-20121206/36433_1 /ASSEMBLY_ACC=CAM_ASM_000192 /TAXON_ID=195065 /ORGANISM="Chroomonas mesostigmatica_cf, Strain CCMP1168" /LENGTH=33 /DNA_ID= /DNA_START= /DNA_END= /DNA_ORIENTATION=